MSRDVFYVMSELLMTTFTSSADRGDRALDLHLAAHPTDAVAQRIQDIVDGIFTKGIH